MVQRLVAAVVGVAAVSAMTLGGFTVIDSINAHQSTQMNQASATTHGITSHTKSVFGPNIGKNPKKPKKRGWF